MRLVISVVVSTVYKGMSSGYVFSRGRGGRAAVGLWAP